MGVRSWRMTPDAGARLSIATRRRRHARGDATPSPRARCRGRPAPMHARARGVHTGLAPPVRVGSGRSRGRGRWGRPSLRRELTALARTHPPTAHQQPPPAPRAPLAAHTSSQPPPAPALCAWVPPRRVHVDPALAARPRAPMHAKAGHTARGLGVQLLLAPRWRHLGLPRDPAHEGGLRICWPPAFACEPAGAQERGLHLRRQRALARQAHLRRARRNAAPQDGTSLPPPSTPFPSTCAHSFGRPTSAQFRRSQITSL